jgi:peroxiredoxin
LAKARRVIDRGGNVAQVLRKVKPAEHDTAVLKALEEGAHQPS